MEVLSDALAGVKVIDVDTHLTEPHNLWTSRAPRGYEERVPQVREVDGVPSWVIDDVVLSPAGSACVVRRDGSKALGGTELFAMTSDTHHPGATEMAPRLEVMDELGIWAQIIYPNTVGLGGQNFAKVQDPELRRLSLAIFNDAMAELQEESGQRLFPMALVPWWDLEVAVAEVERAKGLGLRGFNTNSDPQNQGLPDFGDRSWDPLWEAIADSGLPLNFHIGGSFQQMTYFTDTPWPTHTDDVKLALGSAMIYLGNARVLGNFIYSGVLERHPTLKMVSVESGIGWIPFFLEALDHQLNETAPSASEYLSMMPSEYFRRQVHSCFWFENRNLVGTIEALGIDNCMFETDFPHPTCLYPDSLKHAGRALEGADSSLVRKVMSENAIRVYDLPVDLAPA